MERRPLKALRAAINAGEGSRKLLKELKDDPRAGAQALYAEVLKRKEAARHEAARIGRMLQFEEQARANGFTCIAGVDEAGRGPLAGPIVAAAAVLKGPLDGLNDSKALTAEQREALYARLHEEGHAVGVAVVEPAEIDRIGIQNANYLAMARAVEALDPAPDYVLVDGFALPGMRQASERIVKGDQRSLSIAAASIAAKVTRDRLMKEWHEVYPLYGFDLHKGYATRAHLDAITEHGPCPIHRKSFAPFSRPVETEPMF